MRTLLKRQMNVCRTLTTNAQQASAIEDPVRAKIVELLYRKTLTAEQITGRLAKKGHKKASTTIRHHIEVLRDAGLIDVALIEETRGGVTKHYGTTTRLLGYDLPEDFAAKYSAAIKTASKDMAEIIKTLSPKAVPKSAKRKNDPAYQQYVIAEILNHAMTTSMERSTGTTK